MKSSRLRIALELLCVAVLCAIAFWATRDHARGDTATSDEPLHIFAAAEYVKNGTYVTNPEHPPLTKDLAGLALGSVISPRITRIAPIQELPEMRGFLEKNRISSDELFARGRAPFRWLLVLLIVTVYLGARVSFGSGAAFLAAAIVALDPIFIAHAGVIHTDVAAALFITATLLVAIHAQHSALRWLLTGLLLGLALLAKFSAILIVPLVMLAPLLVPRARLQAFAGAAVACIVALVVVFAGYAVNMRSMPPIVAARASAAFLLSRQCDRDTVLRYAHFTERFPPAGMFVTGIKGVAQTSAHDRGWNFLHGRISKRGFPSYFFIAFAIKSTPAFLLLAAAALFGSRDRRVLVLLIPVAVIFAASVPSSFNIGVRHILPIYPFLAIAGAGILATRLPQRAFAVAALLLVISAAVSLAHIHPFELGYFNALVKGYEGGEEWLSDSNIDWGQDVGRLDDLLRARGWTDTHIIVFANMALWPRIERYPPLQPGTIRPGRYAVSSYMEHAGPQFVREYEGEEAGKMMTELVEALHTRGKVVARAGASIKVWELR
ncbi:MAG TPA: phospholipid carrier-dependent glycosyltransferase [Thermoanaerobaculia bacterium]|nr:phospholipid carrier-dependent glycosyltransferase [Thermoanaerobaculia bacterium]